MSLTRRKVNEPGQAPGKSIDLPVDYVKMVTGILENNFDAGLKALGEHLTNPRFAVTGGIFSDEILLSVSIVSEGKIWATTFHASSDFDPNASRPKAEELLASCLDAVGALMANFLDPKNPSALVPLTEQSFTGEEQIPFEWASFKVNKHEIFLKMDKSHPHLEKLTDEWLELNDPERKKARAQEVEAEQDHIVTGPKKRDPHSEN